MTKRRAAWRGAVAGMASAAAWTILVTAAVALAGGVRDLPFVLRHSAPLFSVAPWKLGAWASTVLAGAGLAGALVGLVGRRLRGQPRRRVLWLWLVFFPAVGLAAGVTFGVAGTVVALADHRPDAWAFLPRMLAMGFFATALLAPALAIPLLAAGVMVERWTRPDAAVIGEMLPRR